MWWLWNHYGYWLGLIWVSQACHGFGWITCCHQAHWRWESCQTEKRKTCSKRERPSFPAKALAYYQDLQDIQMGKQTLLRLWLLRQRKFGGSHQEDQTEPVQEQRNEWWRIEWAISEDLYGPNDQLPWIPSKLRSHASWPQTFERHDRR